jgi:DNA (cytosine-5)-methyltransferase 1
MGRQDYETETLIAHSLRGEGFDAGEDGTGRGTPLVPVAFTQNSRSEVREIGGDGQVVGALAAEAGAQQQNYVAFQHAAASVVRVRRLTPRECERLQGFPDDFTLVPYRKGMMADGPRYKMLGNSMAVPVVRWIGERIQAVEAIGEAKAEAA